MDNLEDKGNDEEELVQHVTTFYPIVQDEFKPKVGMQFDCLYDALNFYTSYSKMAGFGVRKHSTNYHKITKELCSQAFVCSKEGHSKDDKCKTQIGYEDDNKNDGMSTSKRKREIPHKGKKRTCPIIRENCQARIRVTKNKEGTWKVMHFEEGHSHALLTASKTDFLRLHGDGVELHGDCNKTSLSNLGELHSIFNRLAKKAYLSPEKFELAKQKLLEIEKLVEDVVDEVVDEGVNNQVLNIELHHGIQVHPPAQSKTKENGKRWESGKELVMEGMVKDRLCHGCNKRGVGHDKRTCPGIVGHRKKCSI